GTSGSSADVSSQVPPIQAGAQTPGQDCNVGLGQQGDVVAGDLVDRHRPRREGAPAEVGAGGGIEAGGLGPEQGDRSRVGARPVDAIGVDVGLVDPQQASELGETVFAGMDDAGGPQAVHEEAQLLLRRQRCQVGGGHAEIGAAQAANVL